MFAGLDDGFLVSWALREPSVMFVFGRMHKFEITCIEELYNDSYLALGSADGSVTIINPWETDQMKRSDIRRDIERLGISLSTYVVVSTFKPPRVIARIHDNMSGVVCISSQSDNFVVTHLDGSIATYQKKDKKYVLINNRRTSTGAFGLSVVWDRTLRYMRTEKKREKLKSNDKNIGGFIDESRPIPCIVVDSGGCAREYKITPNGLNTTNGLEEQVEDNGISSVGASVQVSMFATLAKGNKDCKVYIKDGNGFHRIDEIRTTKSYNYVVFLCPFTHKYKNQALDFSSA